MPKIFISYRREDSQHQADRLHAALKAHVSDPRRDIFIDVDNIPVGVDFIQHLDGQVAQCDVLLALIGPDWLNVLNPKTGKRRLDDPQDLVRIEIASALKRGVPVAPVLLDGAPFPDEEDLPDDLKPLVRRNGVEVRRTTFDADADRLIRGLGLGQPGARAAPKLAARQPAPGGGAWVAPVVVLSLLAIVGGGAWLWIANPLDLKALVGIADTEAAAKSSATEGGDVNREAMNLSPQSGATGEDAIGAPTQSPPVSAPQPVIPSSTSSTNASEDERRKQNEVKSIPQDVLSTGNGGSSSAFGLPPESAISRLPETSKKHLREQRAKVIGEMQRNPGATPAFNPSAAAKNDQSLSQAEQAAWDEMMADLRQAIAEAAPAQQERRFSALGLSTAKKRIVVVFDMSASMQEFASAGERALSEIIGAMQADTEFAIIGYRSSNILEIYPGGGGLSPATSGAVQEALSFARGLPPKFEGGTPTRYALESALVRYPTAECLILMSDGEPTDGLPADIIRGVEQVNSSRRAEIHTVAMGNYTPQLASFLRELANRNGGQFVETSP